MASPSSLREPVKMRSTATTTLWELVSPICSCRLASLLESRPPLAITDNKQHQKRWVREILHTGYQWGSTQFWLKFSSFYTIQSTINLIQSMFNSKREKYWIKIFTSLIHFCITLISRIFTDLWNIQCTFIVTDVVHRLLPSGSKASRGCPAFCISLSLWWPLFDLGLTPVPINWASSSCEMHLAIYGEERKCMNKYKSKVHF